MKKIDEEFLQFLWKNQHFTGVLISSLDGESIKVHDPGMQNTDSGPDFFNARIEIDGTLWAGNVELHINASDWIKHKHSKDPAYDSVILHVVYFNDCTISRSNGKTIPTGILRFPHLMWDSYLKLKNNSSWIPCQEYLKHIEPVHFAQWTSSLMIQKLEAKMDSMNIMLSELQSHWDAILTRVLFRSFGLHINTSPFEILSLSIPYSLLLRYKGDVFALESILLGQAGMLDTALPHDAYSESLTQEFARHSGKLRHSRVPYQSWKYMRMRPHAFPSLRIAQLAALINKRFPMHSYIETLPSIREIHRIFNIKAGDYWNDHFQLGKKSTFSQKFLGKGFINMIIINSISPYSFFYGKITKNNRYCDYAIHLLESLAPEDNKILKNWGKFGLNSSSAFESQALLYLYKEYCKCKRCLYCQFGNNVIINVENKK
jgi:hypothetical protein